MKRIIYTACLVVFATFLGVLWFGTGSYFPIFGRVLLYGPVKDWNTYLFHFGVSWLISVILTVSMTVFIRKILKINFLNWKGQNFIALILGIYSFTILLGTWMHYRLFGAWASGVYDFLLTFCFLSICVFVVYRIAEAVRRSGVKVQVNQQTRKQWIILILKLLITGIIIFVVTIYIPGDKQNQLAKMSLVMGKFNTERSDVVRCLALNTLGISHTKYLDALNQVSKTLSNAGAKVIVVPLPEGLRGKEFSRDETVEKISHSGNIVFAIPANEKNLDPVFSLELPFSVDRPVGYKTRINLGVISAESIPAVWPPYKYYPLSYWEIGSGDVVPDIAVEAVRVFKNADKSELSLRGQTFSLLDYQTGLMKDQSSIIQYRIYDLFPPELYGTIREAADSITYTLKGNIISSNPSEEVWRSFNGKIVIIEPGSEITRINHFSWVYGNIIHNILEKESTIPLDAWTPFITGFFIIISLLLTLFLKPWKSLLSIMALAVGQWYFYHWLASTYSIFVEPSRPFVGTLFSLFAFSFILIAHERKLMEQNEKKRILDELKSAHDMQMGLMPTEDPRIEGYDISGLCRPANEVGGDYFDYVWLDEEKNKLGIAVADVSGKAMKAAITAVMTSGMVYREVGTNETPKSILKKINRPMYLKTDKNVFTALSFAVINLKQRELTFSNAGQMTPLLKRGDTIRSIKVEGPRLPLGIKEEVEYNETTEQLQSGDVLFLFTDGIIEAKNNKEELWGFERMEETVKKLPQTMNSKEMGKMLIAEANEFAGTAKQHDDMTIVVVRVL